MGLISGYFSLSNVLGKERQLVRYGMGSLKEKISNYRLAKERKLLCVIVKVQRC